MLAISDNFWAVRKHYWIWSPKEPKWEFFGENPKKNSAYDRPGNTFFECYSNSCDRFVISEQLYAAIWLWEGDYTATMIARQNAMRPKKYPKKKLTIFLAAEIRFKRIYTKDIMLNIFKCVVRNLHNFLVLRRNCWICTLKPPKWAFF